MICTHMICIHVYIYMIFVSMINIAVVRCNYGYINPGGKSPYKMRTLRSGKPTGILATPSPPKLPPGIRD